ncbi:HU family DNA-binding protein [Fusobacterium sp. THCT13E1]|uniref:HU family DNA-binding protein n=1 Tax=Fusobacterium ulcerans TaxID=861 RepID=UPI001030AE1D|nr:HU family DNA-binding protein [Fusobacterium ulcerans]
MTEGKFIRFYKKRNALKNQQEVKEKIDLFWNTLLKVLNEGEKVTFKNWGTFEQKEVRSRKIVISKMDKVGYTKAKKKIRFKAGAGLQDIVNGAGTDE